MKKFLTVLFVLVLSIGMGAGVAMAMLPFCFHVALSRDMSGISMLLMTYTVLFSALYGGQWLCTLLHESGHMLAGMLTGYRFVSIRVRSRILLRRKGKLLLRRFAMQGTGGQCIMVPRDPERVRPSRLYDLGGPLMNGLALLLLLPLHLSPAVPLNTLGGGVVACLMVINLQMLIMNLLPIVPNDGRNALQLRDEADSRCQNQVMQIAALQAEDVPLPEMPEELFRMPEGCRPGSVYAGNLLYDQSSFLLMQHRFEEARAVLTEWLNGDAKQLHPLLKMLVEEDLLYLQLIGENRAEEINRLYTPAMQKRHRRAKYSTGAIRTSYALAVMRGDEQGKQRALARMQYLDKVYPYPADLACERSLMQLADEAAASRQAAAGE